jgi:hypothetical protein
MIPPLTASPNNSIPALLSNKIGSINPTVGTTNATITITNDEPFSYHNDYPNGVFNSLENGWANKELSIYLLIPDTSFTGTTYGTITINQVLSGGNVIVGARTFFKSKSSWLRVPIVLHQYPDNATSLALVVSVVLPAGAVSVGAYSLYLCA